MPGRSWSLQALETCPGAVKKGSKNKELVDACKGCYARSGFYRMPNVIDARAHNKQDWKRPEWIGDMVAELQNDRWFRWFDSGDLYSTRLAEKIYSVMQQTPHCNHWLPTRSYKFSKFHRILAKMAALPNVVVRLSSDRIFGGVPSIPESLSQAQGATIVPQGIPTHRVPENNGLDGFSGPPTICPASKQNGK